MVHITPHTSRINKMMAFSACSVVNAICLFLGFLAFVAILINRALCYHLELTTRPFSMVNHDYFLYTVEVGHISAIRLLSRPRLEPKPDKSIIAIRPTASRLVYHLASINSFLASKKNTSILNTKLCLLLHHMLYLFSP